MRSGVLSLRALRWGGKKDKQVTGFGGINKAQPNEKSKAIYSEPAVVKETATGTCIL
jgi:hypothetical protein